MGARAYEEHVSQFLSEFVKVERLPYYARDDIRAIVISGEASVEGIAALERIAYKAVGTEPLEYVAEIDAAEVVAHSAAEYARITQRHPEKFKVDAVDFFAGHDEL